MYNVWSCQKDHDAHHYLLDNTFIDLTFTDLAPIGIDKL